MNSVKVSVIVPVYNVSRYLENCVNSITSQDFSDLRLYWLTTARPTTAGRYATDWQKRMAE
ncbi:MAG: hypothetical protein ACLR56_11175 [Oscillospiraceae bacterium]